MLSGLPLQVPAGFRPRDLGGGRPGLRVQVLPHQGRRRVRRRAAGLAGGLVAPVPLCELFVHAPSPVRLRAAVPGTPTLPADRITHKPRALRRRLLRVGQRVHGAVAVGGLPDVAVQAEVSVLCGLLHRVRRPFMADVGMPLRVRLRTFHPDANGAQPPTRTGDTALRPQTGRLVPVPAAAPDPHLVGDREPRPRAGLALSPEVAFLPSGSQRDSKALTSRVEPCLQVAQADLARLPTAREEDVPRERRKPYPPG